MSSNGRTDARRKKHAKVEEGQEGGFHVVRFVRCRCGWALSHYNRGYLNEQYREHARFANGD